MISLILNTRAGADKGTPPRRQTFSRARFALIPAAVCCLFLSAFSPAPADSGAPLSAESRPPTITAPKPPTAPKAPLVVAPVVPGAEKTTPPPQDYAAPPRTSSPPIGGYVSPQELAAFTQSANAVRQKIQRAYPDFVADLEIKQSTNGLEAWLNPLSGPPVLLADQKTRRDDALWNTATVADTLKNPQAAPYTQGEGGREPKPGFCPGRARSTALLKALYGQSPEEVRAACESVDFLGQKVIFSSRHGAAAALRRVVQRLNARLAEHPGDRVWVLPCAGTYANRRVAGSEALSAHAFAVAIDLNPEKSPYWRWRPAPDTLQNARDNFPQGIVDAFEAEGFVWGGKWHAYDFMHFEYRPEIVE